MPTLLTIQLYKQVWDVIESGGSQERKGRVSPPLKATTLSNQRRTFSNPYNYDMNKKATKLSNQQHYLINNTPTTHLTTVAKLQ